jgi:hypothetical protein
MKSASDRHGSLPSLLDCWRRKWNCSSTFPRALSVHSLASSPAALAGEAVYATCRDQVLLNDDIPQSSGFSEDLARLRTLPIVLENASVLRQRSRKDIDTAEKILRVGISSWIRRKGSAVYPVAGARGYDKI